MTRRRVVYVSGTRADFGLMRSTLERAAADPRLDVGICVTGMHLAPRYGNTVADVEESGVPILARIPVALERSDGATMARAIAHALLGLVDAFSRVQPDLVLVLGDRGEMLAGALAAIHLNVPVAHLHGGETSGTVDEPIRHAISKLAHYHFVASVGARDRLIRMGELPDRIHVTGAPGLDAMLNEQVLDRARSAAIAGLDPARAICLVVFHPVVQQAGGAGNQMEAVLTAALATGMQVLCLEPNADAGADAIRAAIRRREGSAGLKVLTHLPRHAYLGLLRHAEVMVGNSSSGIIEAPSFGLPVVNVGDRQRSRERGGNVVDCEPTAEAIARAIEEARRLRGRRFVNPYGDGRAGERIAELLVKLPLTPALLEKRNAY